MSLPLLPEWSKQDDLGGLVPSEIRSALRAYGQQCTDEERERCAKLCDAVQTMHEGVADAEQSTEHNNIALGAEVCAAAIRSAP